MIKPTDAEAGVHEAAFRRREALQGVRVLDLTRLAPGPYCTMLLADMGADVIVVGGGAGSLPIAALARGKRFIQLNLKSPEGRDAFHRLAATADVVVEGYRPGVTERLGIDYETLRGFNPKIVYCSLTGYGQSGPLSQEAGHDLNYLAVSGALGSFGPEADVPAFPLNLLADFAGGSLFAAFGIMLALYDRAVSGKGQYIDASMVDGCMSMMTMHFKDWGHPVLQARGDGLVAGNAPFYRCYKCADGRFVAVGALERRFFENLWRTLGYSDPPPANHLDRATWPALFSRFERSFLERSRDAWTAVFEGRDACVSPVLNPSEALCHPHNRGRHPNLGDQAIVAPILSETLGSPKPINLDDKTVEVLTGLGYSTGDAKLIANAASEKLSGLAWPPI